MELHNNREEESGIYDFSQENAKAEEAATKVALGYEFDFSSFRNMEIPSVFGGKWQRMIKRERDLLVEGYEHRFDDLLVLANRLYIFACHSAAYTVAAIFERAPTPNTALQAALSTPDGYADYEGWACTMYNDLACIDKQIDLPHSLGFTESPTTHDLLSAMAICWFVDASDLVTKDAARAYDMLHEVADALRISDFDLAWEEADAYHKENLRASGKAGAAVRHAPMNALRDWAVKKYQAGKWPSANAAAYELLPEVMARAKELRAPITPSNAQRTLADWFRKYA